MKKIFYKYILVITASIFFGIFLPALKTPTVSAQGAQLVKPGETIHISVVAVNPSAKKVQKVPVKAYLPEEVTPKDILSPGGLDVEFDVASSIYYLYKDGLELQPKETRKFDVEIADVWMVSQEELDSLRKQTKTILRNLEGTEYYEIADKLGDTIYKSLDTVALTQNEEVSTRRHIGIYRNNTKIVQQIKDDIARLEQQTGMTTGPPPDPLNAKIRANSPTKSTTWMIIFVIMVFMGLLAAVFFLTWNTQSRMTKDGIMSARREAFPSDKTPSEEAKTNEKGSS